MGLQDDLQAEVDRIRAKQADEYAEQRAQEAYYRDHLKPVMLRCISYFSELVEKLKVVAPEITVTYPLDPELAAGLSFQQRNYRVRADGNVNPGQVDILCSCELAKPYEFFVPGEVRADNRQKQLHAYSFPHHRKNRLDAFYNVCGATFILEGPMTARIRLNANAADECIEVELRNFFDDPQPRRYKFEPEDFDEALLERMGEFLLRRVPQLVETKVSEAYREQLRDQVRREKKIRRRDQARARRELATGREAQRQARLVNRAKRKLGDLIGEAGKALSHMRAGQGRDHRDA